MATTVGWVNKIGNDWQAVMMPTYGGGGRIFTNNESSSAFAQAKAYVQSVHGTKLKWVKVNMHYEPERWQGWY